VKIREITDFEPSIGDIVEFETDPDTVVEGVIVAETEDGYVFEFSSSGLTELVETCTYGKYYCSTDKKYKCRKGPKQSRNVAEEIDIGQEWMSDTELDQYVPDQLQQEWRELVGYDMDGMSHPLWRNMTGIDEPNSLDPEHRKQMVRVANKWFAMKKIPNIKFFDVKDADDELEWLVQVGKSVAEAHPNSKIYDKCWDGYRKVPGKKRGEKGSCVKEASGYIPRNSKEAKDPRWSSALTSDVTTHTMRDQIGKFFPTSAPIDGQKQVTEAEYQGRTVPLGKPMKGDVKKSKVYVRNDKGNVVKVNFGDPNMRIKKSSPKHRKSFRARHNCDNPGPRWKARYWSCKAW
jgi:hypothetical protein